MTQQMTRPLGFSLTERQEIVLSTLCHRVRRAMSRQFAAALWPPGPSGELNAQRAIQRLIDAGYLDEYPVIVEELQLFQPLVMWAPRETTPDLAAVARHIQERWTGRGKVERVLVATNAAVGLYGGFAGGRKLPDQASHDIHVAQIYLRLLTTQPSVARQWKSEERLAYERRRYRRPGDLSDLPHIEKVPDAVLCDDAGNIRSVIEFSGEYKLERLQRLHRYCVENAYPYECW
jgi:hypothetical protein